MPASDSPARCGWRRLDHVPPSSLMPLARISASAASSTASAFSGVYALLRGRHRYRLLIAARRSSEVQKVIRTWLDPLRFPPGVRVAVDIDPYSFV